MNSIRNIFKNSGIIVLGYGCDVLFSLLISILLAKYFGQSEFGKISFLGIFFFLLGSADSLWIRPILITEMTRDKDRASVLLGNGMMIRGLLSVVAVILFWATIKIAGVSNEIFFLAIISSCNLILGSFIFSYETVFRSYLGMGDFVKSKLASNLLTVALIGLVIILKGNLFHFFLVSLIPNVFLLVLTGFYSGRLLKPSFKIDAWIWNKIFAKGWFLGLSVLFIFIYHRIDQFMLFRMQGSEMTGLYSAGVRLVEGLNIVPVALMSSLLPFMAVDFGSSPVRFKEWYCLSFKYLLIFIVPVAFGVAFFSQAIISFFYGQQYAAAGPALSILIFAQIFVFLGIVNNTILVASNRQFLDPIFTGSSAVINVILNFLLIRPYGLKGAAFASLIAYAVGPVMGYFISETRDYTRSIFYYSLKPLCSSLIVLSFNYFFHFSLSISLVFSPFIYLGALYFLRSFDADDTRFFKLFFSS